MAKIKLAKAAIDAAQLQARPVELCDTLVPGFMSDYSKVRNKPSTQKGYQGNIDCNIILILGRMKVWNRNQTIAA